MPDRVDPVEDYMSPLEYLRACRLVVEAINAFNGIAQEYGDEPLPWRADAAHPRNHCIERTAKDYGLRIDRGQDGLHELRFPKKKLGPDGSGPSWCLGCCAFGYGRYGDDGDWESALLIPDYLVQVELSALVSSISSTYP